jgi:hypothetical protein
VFRSCDRSLSFSFLLVQRFGVWGGAIRASGLVIRLSRVRRPTRPTSEPVAGLAGFESAHADTSLAVIDAIREAANSMANAIPSRRRQISTTALASSALASEKCGAMLRARSTNNVTASESVPAPTSSEGTATTAHRRAPAPRGWLPRS